MKTAKNIIIYSLLINVVFGDTTAVRKLIQRQVGEKSHQFILKTDESSKKDFFSIEAKNGKILLTANNNISLTSGFNHYLKYVADCNISANGSQLNLPKILPKPAKTIRKETPLKIRNYLNYCTYCYTMAFWDWERWEQELDWMAMNGINQPLMIVGCEKVWQNVLKRLNFSDKDIAGFIPSSAYTAWWLMGNLEGEGGPLTQNMIDYEYKLAKKILSRMRELGMEPILQGFVGLVPRAFKKYHPNAKIIEQGNWVGPYPRPNVLDPTSEMFPEVAEIWYEELTKLYGKSKYYGGDLFHEGGHSGGIKLDNAARAVYKEMNKCSPKSIWVMQAWGGNPKGEILSALDVGTVLVQCLDSNIATLPTPNYHGHYWTWNFINNFGGNDGLYGNLKIMAKIPSSYIKNRPEKLIGVGNVSEGMLHNPVVFDIFADAAWEKENLNVTDWLKNYTTRRYGKVSSAALEAWKLLERSIYNVPNNQQGATESVLCARPNLYSQKASSWGTGRIYYNMNDIVKAAELLIKDAKKLSKSAGYKFDCVDITRQMMQNYARILLEKVAKAHEDENLEKFIKLSSEFLALINDTDKLLETQEDFLVGKWIADARAKGKAVPEKELYEKSARMLVTTWIRRGSSLNDYGHRQWAGLMKDFYGMRWKHYFTELAKNIENSNFSTKYTGLQKELDWLDRRNTFTAKPKGNAVKVSMQMVNKYAPRIKELLKAQTKLKKIGTINWKLDTTKPQQQQFKFDVTRLVSNNGNYQIDVQWKSGNSALEIHELKIVKESVVVSSSNQKGWTGVENRRNKYKMTIKNLSDEAGNVVMILDVKGVSSLNSAGIITIYSE